MDKFFRLIEHFIFQHTFYRIFVVLSQPPPHLHLMLLGWNEVKTTCRTEANHWGGEASEVRKMSTLLRQKQVAQRNLSMIVGVICYLHWENPKCALANGKTLWSKMVLKLVISFLTKATGNSLFFLNFPMDKKWSEKKRIVVHCNIWWRLNFTKTSLVQQTALGVTILFLINF